MSNRNPDESSGHRKPKVSLAMLISQGLGGPNPDSERNRGDGQPVNIPAPLYFFKKVRKLVVWVYYWIYIHILRSNPREMRSQGFGSGDPNEQLSQKSF